MRALVVYESMYGNTHRIAGQIAAGLEPKFEVTLVPVAEATAELVAAADLLVVGAPTHMHRLPTPASRRMAAAAVAKKDSGLVLDPQAGEAGVREWLSGIDAGHGRQPAAAFDTRLDGLPVLTGRASHGIARLVAKHGYRLIVEPQSFLVNGQNELVAGEDARARQWGSTLGGLTRLYLTAGMATS